MAGSKPESRKNCVWDSFLGSDSQTSAVPNQSSASIGNDWQKPSTFEDCFVLSNLPKVEEFATVCCKICRTPVKLQCILKHMSSRHPDHDLDRLRTDEDDNFSFRIMIGCIPDSLLSQSARCSPALSPASCSTTVSSLSLATDVKHEPPDAPLPVVVTVPVSCQAPPPRQAPPTQPLAPSLSAAMVVQSDDTMAPVLSLKSEVPGAFVDILNKFESDASLEPPFLPPPPLPPPPPPDLCHRKTVDAVDAAVTPVSCFSGVSFSASPLARGTAEPVEGIRKQRLCPLAPPHLRQYDPSRHCGVWIGERSRHCTRVLDCRQHNLEQKALVARPLPFRQLLQRFKAGKAQMKPMSVRYDPKLAPANGHPAAVGSSRQASPSAAQSGSGAANGSPLRTAASPGMVTYRDITNSPMFRRDVSLAVGAPLPAAPSPTAASVPLAATNVTETAFLSLHQPRPLAVCGASLLRRRSLDRPLQPSGAARRALGRLLTAGSWTCEAGSGQPLGVAASRAGCSLLKRRLSAVTVVARCAEAKRRARVSLPVAPSGGADASTAEAGVSGTVTLQWSSSAVAANSPSRPQPRPLAAVVTSPVSSHGSRSLYYQSRTLVAARSGAAAVTPRGVCLSLHAATTAGLDGAALISSNACP